MINLLKDRYKFSLVLTTVFFAAATITAYQIYNLPRALMLSDGFHPAMVNVYLSVAVTFLVGGLTLWTAINSRNEVIVYKEKLNIEQQRSTSENQGEKTTISLASVQQQVASASGQKEIVQAGLHAICKELEAGQGAAYQLKESDGQSSVELMAGYALAVSESNTISYALGEGLIGQAAASGSTLYLDDVPEGYIKIISGLGSASPRFLLIVAMKTGNAVHGILEIASFSPITENQRKFVEESAELIAARVSGN